MDKVFTSLIFLAVFLWSKASVPASQPSCQTSGCHQDLGKGAFVHGPMRANGCTVCHVVKKKEGAGHPIFEKLSNRDINKTCFLCHEEMKSEFDGAPFVHKPIGEKSCVACHNPHQSDHKFMLRESGERTLCLSCHTDKAGKGKQFSHHKIDQMKGECLACHSPHFSKHAHLLKERPPGLCLSCHGKVQKGANHEIQPINSWANLDQSFVHAPAAKGECTACHNQIHGSTKSELFEESYSSGMYLSESPGKSMGLCFKCHKESLVSKKEVSNETKFRNGSENLHYFHILGGKRIRNCMICHDPHGSEQGHLIHAFFVNKSPWKLPIVYKKTPRGGTCATACHKTMEYNRAEAVNNVHDR